MALNFQNDYHRYQRYFGNVSRFQSKKTGVYSSVILSIFTVSFFLFFAIKPTLVTVATLNKEIKDKQEVSAKLTDKITSLDKAQREYLALKDDLHLVQEALPENGEVDIIVKQIETLTKTQGVNFKSAQYDQTPIRGVSKSTQTQSLSFNTTTTGSYQSLKSFLASLSSLRRISLVSSFTFATASQKEEQEVQKTGDLDLTVSASVYYLMKDQ